MPRFDDQRGSFTVVYEERAAAAAGLPTIFVQDNQSISVDAGTIRGLHLQLPPHQQGKLVRVAKGKVVDIVVDLRPQSPTHGQHERFELSADDGEQLWIPGGFAHGFCTVEPHTEVCYKVDAPYAPHAEWSLAWDDPTLDLDWPVERSEAVLSEKDLGGASLAETVAAIEAASVVQAGRAS